MIIGIGIDMIEVDRVLEKISKTNGFRETVFSMGEIAYCESQHAKGEHFAARFAAKEAFLKATGLGLTTGYSLCDIEIINDAKGKPQIILHGEWKNHLKWNKIHLTMTHLNTVASAVVILEE